MGSWISSDPAGFIAVLIGMVRKLSAAVSEKHPTSLGHFMHMAGHLMQLCRKKEVQKNRSAARRLF